VRRLLPTILVLGLLVATTAAFVITERLKLQPVAITDVRVPVKVLGPTCGCDKARVRVGFRLRHRDRVTVSMVDRSGAVVRTLLADRRLAAGKHDVVWDGRDDVGDIVPQASYRPRIELRRDSQTFNLPNPILVDTTPPRLQASIRPTTISPDGDGHNDRVSVRYRQSEAGHPFIAVDGEVTVRSHSSKRVQKLDWYGKEGRRPLPPGLYSFVVDTRDLGGNEARTSIRTTVRIRYIELARKLIRVAPGGVIRVGVSTDVRRFHWRLGARTGTAGRPRLVVRAPLAPGRYTLVVSERGFRSAARVVVRPR
jgi:hypothetical protein